MTKNFVKPTAKERQFINGKSHHPQSTFKSILFGEAIRLRRLNQRKEDYLSSLNRLKEKAIRSSFPLGMTNDSNGIKKGGKTTGPKRRKERWPTSLGCIFSPPDNSHKEREKLKLESNDNLQKTNYNWTSLEHKTGIDLTVSSTLKKPSKNYTCFSETSQNKTCLVFWRLF